MPEESNHKIQYQHNIDFVKSFYSAGCQFYDWVINVYFYATVHLVEAFLAKQGIHPNDHHNRLKYIREYLPDIQSDYLRLYHNSRRARYAVWMPSFRDVDKLIKDHYNPLKGYIEGII